MACLCGSNQMQPCRVVWEQGTTSSSSMTFGAGLAGRHVVPFLAGTGGSNQSLFAQRCSPPAEPKRHTDGCCGVLLGIVGLLLLLIGLVAASAAWREVFSPSSPSPYLATTRASMSGALLGAAMSSAISIAGLVLLATYFWAESKNTRDYPAKVAAHRVELAQWNRTWVCLNCGRMEVR